MGRSPSKTHIYVLQVIKCLPIDLCACKDDNYEPRDTELVDIDVPGSANGYLKVTCPERS